MKPAQLKVGRGKVRPKLVPKRQGFLRSAMDEIAQKASRAMRETLQADVKRIAAGIPAQIQAPGYGAERGTSWIKPGRYKMAGGSIAVVEEPIEIKFGIGMRQSWHAWRGQIEGHQGEKLVWGLDGKRTDAARAHEHDLVSRMPAKKVKK